jgi:hypothetical protein
MGGLNAAYARISLTERMPALVNLVISNVPGPKVPLYMAGARMMTYFPISIVVHGVALNITVQSYAGRVDFGLVACAKAVPDVRQLARDIEAALAELQALAPPAAKKAAGPRAASRAAATARKPTPAKRAKMPRTAAAPTTERAKTTKRPAARRKP